MTDETAKKLLDAYETDHIVQDGRLLDMFERIMIRPGTLDTLRDYVGGVIEIVREQPKLLRDLGRSALTFERPTVAAVPVRRRNY